MFVKNITRRFLAIVIVSQNINMENKNVEIKESIYLDNAATTRVDSEVLRAVNEVMLESYGNASSLHKAGKVARGKLEDAREKIAGYLGCGVKEIVFTSGGTESNNLAIRGLAKANPEKKHIVISNIEHPSLIDTCRDMEKDGYEVDYLEVDSDGLVSGAEVAEKIRDDTLVVCVMHVNNETGTIEPIEEIGKVCKEKGVYFHTDNVQGFLKEKFDLENVDLMSISGHKVNAPKGVGLLYIKSGVKIKAIVTGGGQERNMRSGTENVPGIIGLAAALDVDFKIDKVRASRDKIIKCLKKIPGSRINGSMEKRLYNNISVSFYGIEGEGLMLMLDDDGIYVSTGSACASTKLSESHVLKALNINEMYIHGTLRLSLGVDVIGKEDYIVEKVRKSVERLREMSPFKFSESQIKDDSGEPEEMANDNT